MIALLLAGQFADWASTMWALASGRFVEGNPLMPAAPWWELTAAKALAVTVMALVTSRLTGWRRCAACIGVAVAGAWAAGHNVGLLI